MILYKDLETVRQFYSMYIKKQIEEDNGMVVFSSFNEKTDTIRNFLSNGFASLDVTKYEKDNILVIINSQRMYFSKMVAASFVKKILDYSKSVKKKGVSLIVDTSFFQADNDNNGLVIHELSLLQSREKNRKDICLYYQKDFDKYPSEQRQNLIELHNKVISLEN
jgi:hypothetical protein